MTYGEFTTLVNGYLGVEANRRGTETLRASLLRAALIDLKHFVPFYQDGRAAYVDADAVYLPEKAAECVAEYILSKIIPRTQRDMQLGQLHARAHLFLRLQLYRDAHMLDATGDFRVNSGDTILIQATIDDLDDELTVEDCTIEFLLKAATGDDDVDALVTKTVGAGITIANADCGKIVIQLDGTDTAPLPRGPLLPWKIKVTTPDAEIFTVRTGTLISAPA